MPVHRGLSCAFGAPQVLNRHYKELFYNKMTAAPGTGTVLKKLLYPELSRITNGRFKPFLDPGGGFISETTVQERLRGPGPGPITAAFSVELRDKNMTQRPTPFYTRCPMCAPGPHGTRPRAYGARAHGGHTNSWKLPVFHIIKLTGICAFQK